jgi:UDP-3-O-[3-hydroxymyristoyl] N-acetylglucosamine deacetylase
VSRHIVQTTVVSQIEFKGVGLHSGVDACLRILPAMPGRGIVFRRTDVGMAHADIPALWDRVNQSPLCTKLVNEHGVTVSTVEHVMAALVGCGIHNATVEIDGPEVPILDGSSSAFVRGILSKGIRKLDAPLQAIRLIDTVEASKGEAWARLVPHDTLLIEFQIEFEDAAIGEQRKLLNMSNGSFVRELSNSRTFCRKADVDAMRANGLALGGTLENAVVVDGANVLSPGGLRHRDEAVRHKMLDALGDLGLAGLPILAHYQGFRAGHALTNDLLRALFATPNAFEIVDCDAEIAARLPGAGVHWGEIPEVA